MRASVLSRWELKYRGLAVVKNRVTKDIMEHTLAVEGMQTRARYVGRINCSLSFAFVMNARSLTRLVCVEMRACARLKRRVAKVNTSVSEQVFSWFRGYSRTLNEMKACRHHFLVLYYCAKHNEHIDAGTAKYLNAYSHLNRSKQKQSTSYSCSMKVKKHSVKRKPAHAHR